MKFARTNSTILWLAAAGSVLTLITACPAAVPGTMIAVASPSPAAASPNATARPGAAGVQGAVGAQGSVGATGAAGLGQTGATGTAGVSASAGTSTQVTPNTPTATNTPSVPTATVSPTTPTPTAAPTATVASSTAPGAQAPVGMTATLSNFLVLAGSTVTNAGGTSVSGDLGVSPGSTIVGFDVPGGPGTVNGIKHAADPTAAQAKLDLAKAYDDAKGRSGSPISVTGNLGGMTLAPGLYNSQTSLAISSGDLTLDAKGDPNAVWVFEMGSTLTTTPGRAVILAGGAKANNIFWQVGSSATIGTTSVFKGNIMASQSITLNTGATLEGRALTQTGAVALNANAITKPAN